MHIASNALNYLQYRAFSYLHDRNLHLCQFIQTYLMIIWTTFKIPSLYKPTILTSAIFFKLKFYCSFVAFFFAIYKDCDKNSEKVLDKVER